MEIDPIHIIGGTTVAIILGFGGLVFYGMYKPKKTVKNQAELIYTSPVFIKKDLGSVIEDLSKIKKAEDLFKNRPDISINDSKFINSDYPYECIIRLKGTTEERLKTALEHYFSKVGLPTMIGNDSDWEVCDNVLKKYKRTTKMKSYRGAAGKTVVDLK